MSICNLSLNRVDILVSNELTPEVDTPPVPPSGKYQLDPYKEHPMLRGGYTVTNYSLPAYGIDTIQVEIGYFVTPS
eukprot:gene14769-17451_t